MTATTAIERTRARNLRRDGFTILEIMIATAILTLGLVGILALFPVAIHSGKRIVEQSTAVVVAESVAEAIRDGIRNNLRHNDRTGDSYFIFRHDGVKDPIPATRDKESPRGDYYILLPDYKRTLFSGRTARAKALESAKTFLYPETDGAERPDGSGRWPGTKNGGGRAKRADDDSDDGPSLDIGRGRRFRDVRVDDVYRMGSVFPGLEATGPRVLDDQKIDALKQYSFAFAISPSAFDANLSPNPDQYRPAGRLFHVHVMVFRSFFAVEPGAEPPVPVYELDFEVSI